jgi:hypothetical protein
VIKEMILVEYKKILTNIKKRKIIKGKNINIVLEIYLKKRKMKIIKRKKYIMKIFL